VALFAGNIKEGLDRLQRLSAILVNPARVDGKLMDRTNKIAQLNPQDSSDFHKLDYIQPTFAALGF